ncbi:MAG: class I SAM-dependent methyltransferase [Terriglobales bacterium]
MTVRQKEQSGKVGALLRGDEYLRQRCYPKPGDSLYLHLADLLQALVAFGTQAPIAILDYGCGGSPYRSLFPNATYHRADHVDGVDLDFRTDGNGLLPEVGSRAYDMVLSTQVLEHVSSPRAYLDEAFRVLKPGGVLLLSTHGVYPDHGCPCDFWRWTADGLKLELGRSGFLVQKLHRLTCGPRAVMFWVGQLVRTSEVPSGSFQRLTVKVLRKLYGWQRPRIDRFIDRRSAAYSVMTQPAEDSVNFYIGLIALAEKPLEKVPGRAT